MLSLPLLSCCPCLDVAAASVAIVARGERPVVVPEVRVLLLPPLPKSPIFTRDCVIEGARGRLLSVEMIFVGWLVGCGVIACNPGASRSLS